jgi:hypothetical protein
VNGTVRADAAGNGEDVSLARLCQNQVDRTAEPHSRWYRDCCASRVEEDVMPEERERRNPNEEDVAGRADERDEPDDEEEFEDIEDEADAEEDLEF